jgi:cAMP-dependent protein kinase regulator
VPLFRALPDYEILLVADALKERVVDAETAVVKQGDPGDAFFVIVEGECVVTKDEAEVARLVPGQYFGEVALLRNCPRTATVVAARTTKLISLDGRAFHRLLGPCMEALEEHLKQY